MCILSAIGSSKVFIGVSLLFFTGAHALGGVITVAVSPKDGVLLPDKRPFLLMLCPLALP